MRPLLFTLSGWQGNGNNEGLGELSVGDMGSDYRSRGE